jgi:hypothetical protein
VHFRKLLQVSWARFRSVGPAGVGVMSIQRGERSASTRRGFRFPFPFSFSLFRSEARYRSGRPGGIGKRENEKGEGKRVEWEGE